jgi:hypothetical protein
MNVVLDQLKGVLSDSIAKFLRENVKLEDTDIKTIFGDNMDKVLYHDEGFVKELSSKMSDVVMPAYMKELRYLKKVVSGIDDVSKDLKQLQDKLAEELKLIKSNPQNTDDTVKKIDDVIKKFIEKSTQIAQNKIGLREVQDEGQSMATPVAKIENSVINPSLTTSSGVLPSGVLPSGVLPSGLLPSGVSLTTPSSISNALTNEISKIIQNANKKSGGATQSGGAGVALKHLPNVDSDIDTYLDNYQKTPRIPKRNYNEYNGNVSQLINQIVREKMINFPDKTVLSEEILNSQSYKDAIDSINSLFIAKPDIKAEAINDLIQIIKESKMPNAVLQKILNKTTAQIKASSGGTRKKRK